MSENITLYNNVIRELNTKFTFCVLMKQLKQFNTFDRNGNVIEFRKDAILTQIF
jgi:hypothetical protein